jgi:hypothetical protein
MLETKEYTSGSRVEVTFTGSDVEVIRAVNSFLNSYSNPAYDGSLASFEKTGYNTWKAVCKRYSNSD